MIPNKTRKKNQKKTPKKRRKGPFVVCIRLFSFLCFFLSWREKKINAIPLENAPEDGRWKKIHQTLKKDDGRVTRNTFEKKKKPQGEEIFSFSSSFFWNVLLKRKNVETLNFIWFFRTTDECEAKPKRATFFFWVTAVTLGLIASFRIHFRRFCQETVP